VSGTNFNSPVAAPGETEGMSDDEFLHYCLAHSESPRCGFTPEQVIRLMLLAGMKESASMVSRDPPRVLECDPKTIQDMVLDARLKEGKNP
jgi:hypothetical protein